MLPRAVKIAYAVILIASAATAFLLMRAIDENTVAGPSYVISFDRITTVDLKPEG